MGSFRKFEIVDHSPSYVIRERSIADSSKTLMLNPFYSPFPVLGDELDFALECLRIAPRTPLLLDEFDALTDLIEISETPFCGYVGRINRRVGLGLGSELYLRSLRDRVCHLENERRWRDRKYSWTVEIMDGVDRKYKVVADLKGNENEKKKYKLTAEIKGKGGHYLPFERTYSVEVSSGGGGSEAVKDKKKKKKKGEKVKGEDKLVGSTARIVDFEDNFEHGTVVLRQVFAKRAEKSRGKRRVPSPQDAAAVIQVGFRAYLIRRSQALRALRELAIAKTKLKEIRVLFNNFSYRRRLARDAEERQRLSEKIIVLLLTLDGIEGADPMVRGAKKTMLEELEAMLDMVDPQPPGKSFALRRRTFDMPDGLINKELAAGVAQMVQMLDQEPSGSETFEAYL